MSLYPDFLESHYYPDFIQIKSGLNRDQIWMKEHGRALPMSS